MKASILLVVLLCMSTKVGAQSDRVRGVKRSERKKKQKFTKPQQQGVLHANHHASRRTQSGNVPNKDKLSDATRGGAGRNRVDAYWRVPSIEQNIGGLDVGYIYVDSESIITAETYSDLTIDIPSKKFKGKKNGRYEVLDTYGLGNRRPEGITSGGDSVVYISELLYGGIKSVNLTSGIVNQLVPPFPFMERPASGLWYYQDAIVVAGLGPMFGVTAKLYVHDVNTGKELVSCAPDIDIGLLNDVTVVDGIAYATDSQINQIVVMDMNEAIAGRCDVTSITLPANEFYSDDDGELLAAGIVGYKGGLIVSNFRLGGLYFVNPNNEHTVEIVDRELLPMPSGLVVEDDLLFVTQSYPDSIGVWKLRDRGSGGLWGELSDDDFVPRVSYKGVILSDQFDDPRSSAIVNGYLYAVNSRVKSTGLPADGESQPRFQEEFNMAEIGLY